MSAQITCPTCQTQLLAPPELAGQVVACPTCRQAIQLVAQQPLVQQPVIQQSPVQATPAPIAQSQVASPALVSASRPLPKARPIPIQAAASPSTATHQPVFVQQQPAGQNSPSPAREPAARKKGFPFAALLSWSFILLCIIVPAFLLWRMRANHLEKLSADKSAKRAKQQAKAVDAPLVRPAAGTTTNQVAENTRPSALPAASSAPNVGETINLPTLPQPATTNPAATVNVPVALPTSPPPPMPAPPSDIFSTLASHWQLPTLISTATEPLGRLQSEPEMSIEVAVRHDATTLPAEAVLFAERTMEPSVWSIAFAPNLEAEAGKVKLASLRLADQEWSWQWEPNDEHVALRRQLTNCQLELTHGETRRLVQLRAPSTLPPLKIDLKQDSQKLDFQVSELPKAELLRVAIDGIDGFPAGAVLDKPLIAAGDEAKITFADQPGAEIELRFRSLSSGVLLLQIEPRFRESTGRTYEMTLPRLDAMEEGVGKTLKEAERDLPVRQRELKAAVSAYQSLAGKQPGNPLLLPAWRGEVNSLESKAKRAASRVETLQKQIPQHKARLEAVPKTRSFLKSIDERATIRLRLVVQCPGQEIVLVTASQ